jgi:NifU-like protein involved in Fe-S cluster formation
VASAATLYTPEVLALATGLSAFPLHDGLSRRAAARSPTCGSTLELGLSLSDEGRIAGVGLRAHACAIGQAAAAIFARGALEQDRKGIAASLGQIDSWLRDGGAMPSWPGFSAIARARAYPARHGAIVLAWKAALDALPY